MTIYLSHAPADLAAAEALEKVLERRGHFVELDNGEAALRPVQSSDVVITLVSKDFAFATARLRLEQRALDAWAAGRLILVKLDPHLAPVGLRDQPFVDASFEAQREFKWLEVAEAIRTIQASKPQRPAAAQKKPWDEELDARDANVDSQYRERETVEGVRMRASAARRTRFILCLVLMLPGIAALVTSGAIWLVNRIGPTPGTLADLIAGVDAFGTMRGLPPGVTPIVFAAALALMLLAPLATLLMNLAQRAKLEAYAREHPAIAEDYEGPPIAANSDALFVSYARANSDTVMPVIEAAKQEGFRFWIDKEGISSGDGWAGEIVRGIKGAAGVVIMCSAAAFESDHVKREVYLADRYHKKLLPIYIEAAQAPEDFEYFFAGVQLLNLFETPEAERGAAIARALGAAAA